MSDRWSEYVRAQIVGSQKELSDRSGIGTATLSRWLNGSAPSVEQAIVFARNIGQNPVQALVMSGHVQPKEANMAVSDFRIEDVEDIVLLDELRLRAVRRITQ